MRASCSSDLSDCASKAPWPARSTVLTATGIPLRDRHRMAAMLQDAGTGRVTMMAVPQVPLHLLVHALVHHAKGALAQLRFRVPRDVGLGVYTPRDIVL